VQTHSYLIQITYFLRACLRPLTEATEHVGSSLSQTESDSSSWAHGHLSWSVDCLQNSFSPTYLSHFCFSLRISWFLSFWTQWHLHP